MMAKLVHVLMAWLCIYKINTCIQQPFNTWTPVLILWKTLNQILMTAYTGMFTYVFVFALTLLVFVLRSLLFLEGFQGSGIFSSWRNMLAAFIAYRCCQNVRKEMLPALNIQQNHFFLFYLSSSVCCDHELQQLYNPLSVQH